MGRRRHHAPSPRRLHRLSTTRLALSRGIATPVKNERRRPKPFLCPLAATLPASLGAGAQQQLPSRWLSVWWRAGGLAAAIIRVHRMNPLGDLTG
ncbi:hypothetical protein VFPFJ_04282 [Purpureocillium lilacinum]|uniref:Uncharacterized protein n=1 Tax=Purpureocillium lilacinum TaxID=33203 RepID=A0A179HSK4_PURLI|nr:hypothetical protein VFPFJ_04282 [Purpureocillium lilacinum]OAQ92541.1 hypothetical protein VFPFJ_04282 [Purpureocillium lilacinum]